MEYCDIDSVYIILLLLMYLFVFLPGGMIVFERTAYTVNEDENASICVTTNGPLLDNLIVFLVTQVTSPPSAQGMVWQ